MERNTSATRSWELSAHVEDDPPVIFSWQNVEVFVEAIRAAQAQAVAPGGLPLPAYPLALPGAVNVQNFKEAVLEYARVHGAAARLDTTCLPCSLEQFGQVTFMLGSLDLEPWSHGSSALSLSECQIRCRSHVSTCHVLVRIL
ncbi:unnamed protein product [Phytophthora lilii]|uniref:Unnamed protein product n=1 Tax=Phytophthora lilii TaxID=2077276 RepID=A0A9W6U0H1_9STRA|nr:unnamed protein product [Phytophthora lilii]